MGAYQWSREPGVFGSLELSLDGSFHGDILSFNTRHPYVSLPWMAAPKATAYHATQGTPTIAYPGLQLPWQQLSCNIRHPYNNLPWMAAPMATASSGLTALLGLLPKISLQVSCTLGIRLIPRFKRVQKNNINFCCIICLSYIRRVTKKSRLLRGHIGRVGVKVMARKIFLARHEN